MEELEISLVVEGIGLYNADKGKTLGCEAGIFSSMFKLLETSTCLFLPFWLALTELRDP